MERTPSISRPGLFGSD